MILVSMASYLKVAVLLFDQVNATDVAGPVEAFAVATREGGDNLYQIETWAVGDEIVSSESGLKFCADSKVPINPQADILLIPGGKGIHHTGTMKAIVKLLKLNNHSFSCIASVCTGAYALAESGLMDDRMITTHWAFAEDLQRRYPNIHVRPDSFFLSDGKFYSSGGVTSGIDLAIEIIENSFGGQVAAKVARELVVCLQRTGKQAQFSAPLKMNTSSPNRLKDTCKWAINNLDKDLSVKSLATRAGFSERQFSRLFRETFGTPPAIYIKRFRLDAGRSMLEQGINVSQITHSIGYVSADGFRRAFDARFGVSPSEYQKNFRQKRFYQRPDLNLGLDDLQK